MGRARSPVDQLIFIDEGTTRPVLSAVTLDERTSRCADSGPEPGETRRQDCGLPPIGCAAAICWKIAACLSAMDLPRKTGRRLAANRVSRPGSPPLWPCHDRRQSLVNGAEAYSKFPEFKEFWAGIGLFGGAAGRQARYDLEGPLAPRAPPTGLSVRYKNRSTVRYGPPAKLPSLLQGQAIGSILPVRFGYQAAGS